MKRIKLFLGFLLACSFQMNAQSIDANVSTYLDSNGTLSQYEYAYDQLLEMLSKQYPKSEATANGWEYLENNKADAIADIKKEIIPIYKNNFTSEEINEMTTFYQSDAGKQLKTDRTKLNQMQTDQINVFYNSVIGQKIIQKQEVLSKEISAVSESWSRDLYETALSLLKT